MVYGVRYACDGRASGSCPRGYLFFWGGGGRLSSRLASCGQARSGHEEAPTFFEAVLSAV